MLVRSRALYGGDKTTIIVFVRFVKRFCIDSADKRCDERRVERMRKALAVVLSWALALSCVGSVCPAVYAVSDSVDATHNKTEYPSIAVADATVTAPLTYSDYVRQVGEAPRPTAPLILSATQNYTAEDPIARVEELDGTAALVTGDSGRVTWSFTVDTAGFYDLFFRYRAVEGKGATIERALYLDGTLPFSEARDLVFNRIYEDEGEKIYSKHGNEYRRPQKECFLWQTVRAVSNATFNDEGISLYLSAGAHTLTLESIAEPMALAEIRFEQAPVAAPYKEVLAGWQAAGYPEYNGTPVSIQGEDALYKSTNTLYAVENRTSTITEPFELTKTLLNCIGGTNWKYKHQWVEWEITVPESGLYKIGMRALQDFVSGGNAYRRLTIDGELPFAEAEGLMVKYSMDWQMLALGDGEEPYLFYLEEGRHVLRLTVVLGDMYALLEQANNSVTELNKLYRDVLMITGTVPDTYRDYDLDEKIPHLMDTLERNIANLTQVREGLEALSDAGGEQTVYVNQLLVQLNSFVDRPNTIATRLSKLSENLNSLASWIVSASEVSLLIDKIIVCAPDAALPAADAGFFKALWESIRAFFISFVHDYYAVDSFVETDGEPAGEVVLWMAGASGRDQANIIKNLSDFYFTDQTGIRLTIKLVDMDALLRSVASNSGPDVALFQGQSQAVNYGIRGAAYDLNRFADVGEVTSRFAPSALTSLQYGGKLYALPEQQNFMMMFYRTDVLNELGATAPNTWEEFYRLIPQLSENNYSIGLPTPATVQSGSSASGINDMFSALLLQNKAGVYNADGSRCVLDTLEGIEAFVQWSEFYTKYDLPVSYSDINRFRTGEMPVIITSYGFYNSLAVAAPEIQGLWTMAPIPGTPTADGTVDRSVASNVSCAMLFENAQDVDDAWAFLKWWTSAETQTMYGQEIEALQGRSARWATANLEAMEALPWNSSIAKQIQAQWEWVQGIPEVPGGYYTGRSVDNAIKSVINMGESPRESLLDAVIQINNELRVKRQEFGLE